ncbi:MAG: CDGSH iron-sulfur domain-containing protein [Marmoricola sp.]
MKDLLTTEAAVRDRVIDGPSSARIELIPDGPALVRGANSVEDADGIEHAATRPVVAVCTCGLTQRGPWCDATHKVARTVPR